MAIRKPKPTSAGRRFVSYADFAEITKTEPEKTLVVLSEAEAQTAYSFRNLDRVSVLPADAIGVADLVGAGSVLVSQTALDELTRRATR